MYLAPPLQVCSPNQLDIGAPGLLGQSGKSEAKVTWVVVFTPQERPRFLASSTN